MDFVTWRLSGNSMTPSSFSCNESADDTDKVVGTPV